MGAADDNLDDLLDQPTLQEFR